MLVRKYFSHAIIGRAEREAPARCGRGPSVHFLLNFELRTLWYLPPMTTQFAPPAQVPTSAPFGRECAEFFAEIVQLMGVPKSVGQIYGLLYGSPRPLSFSDIVEELGISKGSASQGLQLLRSLGAVRVAAGGDSGSERSRREYYEPELRLRQLVAGVLREQVTPLTASGAERLARLRRIADETTEGGEFCRDRVKQLETWRRRLKAVLPIVTALLGPKPRK